MSEHDDIDISGIDKAELLAALYNNSGPRGMGFFRAKTEEMTVEQARKELSDGDDHVKDFGYGIGGRPLYFDYLHGRPLKVNLAGDSMRGALYDRDNGHGAAKRIVSGLRAKAGAA